MEAVGIALLTGALGLNWLIYEKVSQLTIKNAEQDARLSQYKVFVIGLSHRLNDIEGYLEKSGFKRSRNVYPATVAPSKNE